MAHADIGKGSGTAGPAVAAAMTAARRLPGTTGWTASCGAGATTAELLTEARCAMAAATSRSEVARVVRGVLTRMGATVAPARLVSPDRCLPPDVSVGAGEPLVAVVSPPSPASV